MQFAIGWLNRAVGAPDVLAYVTAEAPDAPVTGISTMGDDLGFVAVCDAYSDLLLEGRTPTPLRLAVEVAGRDGTVHRVADDGSLIGWRREYDSPSPTLS